MGLGLDMGTDMELDLEGCYWACIFHSGNCMIYCIDLRMCSIERDQK